VTEDPAPYVPVGGLDDDDMESARPAKGVQRASRREQVSTTLLLFVLILNRVSADLDCRAQLASDSCSVGQLILGIETACYPCEGRWSCATCCYSCAGSHSCEGCHFCEGCLSRKGRRFCEGCLARKGRLSCEGRHTRKICRSITYRCFPASSSRNQLFGSPGRPLFASSRDIDIAAVQGQGQCPSVGPAIPRRAQGICHRPVQNARLAMGPHPQVQLAPHGLSRRRRAPRLGLACWL
jgi:hypothetical protein